jgi:histidinol dehydrogenase
MTWPRAATRPDRGDAKFDRLDIAASGLRVTAAEVEAATKGLRQQNARRAEIRARPDRGVPPPPTAKDERFTDALGVELGWRWSAIDAVGLYVPGGTAAYPSSVLMNAVPAAVPACRAS